MDCAHVFLTIQAVLWGLFLGFLVFRIFNIEKNMMLNSLQQDRIEHKNNLIIEILTQKQKEKNNEHH